MTELIKPSKEDIELLVRRGAEDPSFFARTFFPRTFRQESPQFHKEIWKLLDSTARYVCIRVFRDGAKTTLLRAYTARRIAYGLAHTVLYIGKSEGHAIRSVNWLKKAVESNTLFSTAFGLRPGSKWQDAEAEIYHSVDKYPIWIMAAGISGSIRGINRDDFRPDLIVLDDVLDDENCATADQREKIENLIYGAVRESLAPASEMPDAKLVMLQTPLHREDVSMKAEDDPEWTTAVFSCWTPETQDLPVEQQKSAWPARYPSEVLRSEKIAAAARNRLSVFLREKECRLTSPEASAFRPDWLKFYKPHELPENMPCVLVIDPVPPPTDRQLASGLRDKDFEALSVIGRHGSNYYLIDYSIRRGHEPDWTISEFFRLASLYRPFRVLIETVAYQKVLGWLLKKGMEHQRKWWAIKELNDRRPKYQKIVDGLTGVASNGYLYVREDQVDFISQFADYPDVSHDDLIETVALGVTELQNILYAVDDPDYSYSGLPAANDLPALNYVGGAP